MASALLGTLAVLLVLSLARVTALLDVPVPLQSSQNSSSQNTTNMGDMWQLPDGWMSTFTMQYLEPPTSSPACGEPDIWATSNATHVLLHVAFYDPANGNASITYVSRTELGVPSLTFPGTCSLPAAAELFPTMGDVQAPPYPPLDANATTPQLVNSTFQAAGCECPLLVMKEDDVTVHAVADCPPPELYPDAFYGAAEATHADWAVRQTTCDASDPGCDAACSVLTEAVLVRSIRTFALQNPGAVEELSSVSAAPDGTRTVSRLLFWGSKKL